MDAKQVTYQTPRPEIKVYTPEGKLKLQFDTSNNKGLQSYSFKTSVDDVRGQFTLTFHPDEFVYSNDAKPIFDEIQELDIVEIYESKNHFKQYYRGPIEKEVLPTFTGIVRKKRYTSRISGDSATRRLTISGHSVAGLVSNFYMNMDSTAMAVTQRYRSQEDISQKLTTALSFNDAKAKPVNRIIMAVWDAFMGIADSGGDFTTPKIAEIIKKWIGGSVTEIFEIEEGLNFNYPLGCIFDGKSTKSFFDMIEGIIPTPPYERFAYCERESGKMRIRIRECPFERDKWRTVKYHDIPIKLVKGLDIEQDDDEVYTVFFSYVDNGPESLNRALKLTAMEELGAYPTLVMGEKYAIYGYRPLFVHFKGYGKVEDEDDKGTGKSLRALNEKLMRWYGNVELMYKGTLTLATDLSIDMPQAGEVIALVLGSEFYVDASEHKWNYGGSPETILSISRGGIYGTGKFEELKYWGRKKQGEKLNWASLI